MKFEDVKVGMRVKLVSGSDDGEYEFENCFTEDMVEYIGKEYTVATVSEFGVRFEESVLFQFPWECLEPVEQKPSLSNTKINVQKYADDNGISLEQAHKEIQPWLFEQGVEWKGSRDKEVRSGYGPFLHIYSDLRMTQTYSHFNAHENKEITLSRKVNVEITPSFVEVEEPAVEYVELGGRKYVKKDLEEALSKIKAVEE